MKRKYENGYLRKIVYWTARLEDATRAGNTYSMDVAMNRLQYFVNRHTAMLTEMDLATD
jgi:hypothetical protein